MEKRSVAVAVEGKAVKHVNKRAIAILLAIVVTIQITGCGLVSVNHVSEEDEKLVAEYAAGLLLKYENGHSYGLTKVKDNEPLEPEPEIINEEPVYEETVVPEPETSVSDIPDHIFVESDEPETVVSENITDNRSIADAMGIQGFDISYAGYEICDAYPENEQDMYFALTAADEMELIVLHYNVTNTSGEDAEFNTLYNTTKVRLILNGTDRINQQMTMLLNDLKSFEEVIGSGTTVDSVVIFEVEKNYPISTMDLLLIGDDEYTYKLQ